MGITAYSQHSAHVDTAAAQFRANLVILENMLWNAEKELGIRQVVEDLERTHE